MKLEHDDDDDDDDKNTQNKHNKLKTRFSCFLGSGCTNLS